MFVLVGCACCLLLVLVACACCLCLYSILCVLSVLVRVPVPCAYSLRVRLVFCAWLLLRFPVHSFVCSFFSQVLPHDQRQSKHDREGVRHAHLLYLGLPRVHAMTPASRLSLIPPLNLAPMTMATTIVATANNSGNNSYGDHDNNSGSGNYNDNDNTNEGEDHGWQPHRRERRQYQVVDSVNDAGNNNFDEEEREGLMFLTSDKLRPCFCLPPCLVEFFSWSVTVF